MLRWQLTPLVQGIVLIAAFCAVLVMKSDPPGGQIQSIAGMVGKPAGWIAWFSALPEYSEPGTPRLNYAMAKSGKVRNR